MWCIQEITPEFRKRMYNILDLYQLPYDEKNPIIGVDEKPKQLIDEVRTPIPMTTGKIAKQDYQYKRNGTVNIFIAVEFKAGIIKTQVTKRRTKKDFAKFMRKLVLHYHKAEKIHVVLDNLNTHFESSFYETFSKNIVEQILNKFEFHYTPVHASWLNIAEIEIGVMDTQCTERRMKNMHFLKQEFKHGPNKEIFKKIK